MKTILTLTLNPSIDRIQTVQAFTPFDKNFVCNADKFLGGKGINVSFCLGKMGADCTALGFMSSADLPEYESKLDVVNVKSSFIALDGQTRENLKIVDQQTGKDTEFNQPGFPIEDHDLELLERIIEKYLKGASWMILSGSLPPGVPDNYYNRLIGLGRSKGVYICLDASGRALGQGADAGPDILRINWAELQELCGHPIDSNDQLLEELVQLNDQGICYLVISRGSSGAIGFNGEDLLSVDIPTVSPVSLTGAGDAMTAAFIYQLNQEKSFQEALVYSTSVAAASVLCKEPGDFREEDAERIQKEIKVEKIN